YRLGEKPLFYGLVAGRFVFASELRALQRAPFFEARVDPGAVALLLRHSFVPGPHSIFEGVRRLPPGHLMTVRLGQEPDTPRSFWSLAEVAARGTEQQLELPDEELVDRAEALLLDSVRMRMISDVPLGASRWGGVVSSLVVALMQWVSDQPVRTFSVAVGGQYDES